MTLAASFSKFSNVKIEAVAASLPTRKVVNEDFIEQFGEKFASRFGKSTGIFTRYKADEQTTLDLCVEAGSMLRDNGCRLDDVGAVILVTQSADYALPASAIIAQDRLGLPKTVAAFDVNLGCSGYTYGLWLAASLIASQAVGKVLLLAGDTNQGRLDPTHRSTAPIFGDAGTATIVARANDVPDWHFAVGSDGSGSHAIIIPGSGMRPADVDLPQLAGEVEAGKLFMDGSSVFNFATTVVPEVLKGLLDYAHLSAEEVERIYLHQANELILKTIGRKAGFEREQIVVNLDRYGNTSSASIPLAFVTDGPRSAHRAVMCGFGVGLSWSAVALELGEVPVFFNDPERA